MGRRLFLGLGRFRERQNLTNEWLDFSGLDQLADFHQLGRVRFHRDRLAPDAVLCQLGLVQSANDVRNETAFPYDCIRTRKRILADCIQDNVDIFSDVFEFLFGVINRNIGPELLQGILIGGGCGGENFRAFRLGDLDCEAANAAGTAVD